MTETKEKTRLRGGRGARKGTTPLSRSDRSTSPQCRVARGSDLFILRWAPRRFRLQTGDPSRRAFWNRPRRPIYLGAALALAFCCAGASATAIEGFWSGGIQVAGAELAVMVEIERRDARWGAVFYAPAQGIRAAELIDVAVEDRSVTFRIPDTPGEPRFHGEVAADGATISGNFTQAGRSTPFLLRRTEKPSDLERDIYAEFLQPGVPGAGLEGTWRALMESGLHRMRLVMSVRESNEGRLEGRMRTLEQTGDGQRIPGFVIQNDTVWFSIDEIGAEFDGRLDHEGSELKGLWRQNGQELALTFRRSDEP